MEAEEIDRPHPSILDAVSDRNNNLCHNYRKFGCCRLTVRLVSIADADCLVISRAPLRCPACLVVASAHDEILVLETEI